MEVSWQALRQRPQENDVAVVPNKALQPTTGRPDVSLSDDFNIKLRIKARSRQRWLSSVSLGCPMTIGTLT
jgi:hypothetical protein